MKHYKVTVELTCQKCGGDFTYTVEDPLNIQKEFNGDDCNPYIDFEDDDICYCDECWYIIRMED